MLFLACTAVSISLIEGSEATYLVKVINQSGKELDVTIASYQKPQEQFEVSDAQDMHHLEYFSLGANGTYYFKKPFRVNRGKENNRLIILWDGNIRVVSELELRSKCNALRLILTKDSSHMDPFTPNQSFLNSGSDENTSNIPVSSGKKKKAFKCGSYAGGMAYLTVETEKIPTRAFYFFTYAKGMCKAFLLHFKGENQLRISYPLELLEDINSKLVIVSDTHISTIAGKILLNSEELKLVVSRNGKLSLPKQRIKALMEESSVEGDLKKSPGMSFISSGH